MPLAHYFRKSLTCGTFEIIRDSLVAIDLIQSFATAYESNLWHNKWQMTSQTKRSICLRKRNRTGETILAELGSSAGISDDRYNKWKHVPVKTWLIYWQDVGSWKMRQAYNRRISGATRVRRPLDLPFICDTCLAQLARKTTRRLYINKQMFALPKLGGVLEKRDEKANIYKKKKFFFFFFISKFAMQLWVCQ